MSTVIHPEKVESVRKGFTLIDVRSPAEFEAGHITGSHSLPLFENEERAQVGTIYKNQGKDVAVEKGLELVGPKLLSFVKKARKLSPDKRILLYCWRGGMRSASMAWLLETAGFECSLIEGGYKAYRNYGKSVLEQLERVCIIGGFTGSGKTVVLKTLQELGEQILDIEELAHHRGSTFGAIGQEPQFSNEQFENEVIQRCLELDTSKRIWIEDESRILGKNHIPDELFSVIRNSRVFKLNVPLAERAIHLVEIYGQLDPMDLEAAIRRIERKLGGQHMKVALEALENGNLKEVASIGLKYYDKTYSFGLSKRNPESVTIIDFPKVDGIEMADQLISMANKYKI